MIAAVLAPGPSLTSAQADAVRGCYTVAVSDAWRLAPWAQELCSADAAWWHANPDAMGFQGLRKCCAPYFQDVPGVTRSEEPSGLNSGLFGLQCAVRAGAAKVLLLGFDMQGSHFFGPHPAPLKNTTLERFAQFRQQFARFRAPGVDVVNCTPGSALEFFRRGELAQELACC